MQHTRHRYAVQTFVLGFHFSTLSIDCEPEQLEQRLALALSWLETATVEDCGPAPRYVLEASNPSYGSGEWFPWFNGERQGRIAVFDTYEAAADLRQARREACGGYPSYRVLETLESDEELTARTLAVLVWRLRSSSASFRPFSPAVRCPSCGSSLMVDAVEAGAERRPTIAALCNGCEFVAEVRS